MGPPSSWQTRIAGGTILSFDAVKFLSQVNLSVSQATECSSKLGGKGFELRTRTEDCAHAYMQESYRTRTGCFHLCRDVSEMRGRVGYPLLLFSVFCGPVSWGAVQCPRESPHAHIDTAHTHTHTQHTRFSANNKSPCRLADKDNTSIDAVR